MLQIMVWVDIYFKQLMVQINLIKPAAFVSKSLNKSQLRWSVIQKEAYGIFYSCMYLQSLLRDRFFTIRTDHRNLLFFHH